MTEELEHREHESGVSGVIVAEEFSLKRMFRPQFSRPEPTGGRWFQIGPFGMGGNKRPPAPDGPGKGNWRKRQTEEVQGD